MSQQQQLLEAIVDTWDINPTPEFRGFRCANCQKYVNNAYYHWLQTNRYYVPVHLCEDCQRFFEDGVLSVTKPTISNLNKQFNQFDATDEGLGKLVERWHHSVKDGLQSFYCDKCTGPLEIENGERKGYHVWWKNDGRLHELHFHRKCASMLGIKG